MRSSLLSVPSLILVLSIPLSAETLRVRHDHDPWGSCTGELEITADGMRFSPDEGNHQRTWAWTDIQSFDRRSPDEFSLLTYEDIRWRLGQDRAFDFTVLDGEGLGEATFALVRDHVPRPVIDRVAMEIDAEYRVPVKHLHVFGGCEGVLSFGREWVVYETDLEEDRRSWRRAEIEDIWSSGPFDLELRVPDGGRSVSSASTFRFQLREQLDPEYYERLRRETLLRR